MADEDRGFRNSRMMPVLSRIGVRMACGAFAGAVTLLAPVGAQTQSGIDPVLSKPAVPVRIGPSSLQLPLRVYERVVPLADNKCAVLDQLVGTLAQFNYRWLGACLFGLAHGRGFTVDADGKAYFNHFHYGTRDLRPTVPGWDTTYWSDRSLNPVVSSVAIYRGADFDPQLFHSRQALLLFRWEGLILTKNFFGIRQITCPFTTFQDAQNFVMTGEAQAAVKRVCKIDRGDGGLFVLEQEDVYDLAKSITVPIRPPRQNVRVCAKPGPYSSSDCTAMITQALAPYLDRINAVISADAGARARAMTDLTERFRPLEEARRARIASFAARYAAQERAAGRQRSAAAGAPTGKDQ